MDYLEFKAEYLELCEKFGRDTKRKIANDLKKDIKELEYRIEYLEPQIRLKGVARMYGVLYGQRDLKQIKTELENSKQLLNEI
jgi:hypothetical protein